MSETKRAGQTPQQAIFQQARAHEAAGDIAAADSTYRSLHDARSPDPGLLIAWSRLRRRAGDPANAMAMLQSAGRAGGGAAVLIDMAGLLLDQNRPADAVPLLRQATQAGRGPALDFELARCEAAQGRHANAAGLFRQLMKLDSRAVAPRLGYARALAAMGQAGEAQTAYEALLKRVPDQAQALAELAYLHGMQRRFSAALTLYRRLDALGADVARELSQVALGMMHMCDWSERTATLDWLAERMRRPAPCVIETYALLGGVDDPALHREMGARFAGVLAAAGEGRARPPARSVSPAGGRLRIGYLSGDFSQHATSLLLAGVMEAHDRASFETFAYDYSPEDGSDTRRRMQGAFEHFVPIAQDGPAAAAARIAADGIDILVDLKGYTERTRSEIVALRPAPVQVNFLGYVGTQAADWIDYVIADDMVLPQSDYVHWQEQPVTMPASYYPNDRTRPVPEPDGDRAAHGLPQGAMVFCCFNSPFKISPEIFAVWLGLLRDVPGSVLWLYEGNDFMAANLRGQAGALADRLHFTRPMPLAAHLARHGCADLFLDTLPYGAHTTGADALWAGVPMVTCLGASWASRVGGSLLRAVGLPELVCTSLDDYAALARALAADPGRRAALRAHLIAARQTAPLFDAPAFCRALESAYVRMAERARAGAAPAPLRL